MRDEEQRYERSIQAWKWIAENAEWDRLSGEQLSTIHHTHGLDPDTLHDLGGRKMSEVLRAAYEAAYEEHCASGKRGQKKVVLVGKTA